MCPGEVVDEAIANLICTFLEESARQILVAKDGRGCQAPFDNEPLPVADHEVLDRRRWASPRCQHALAPQIVEQRLKAAHSWHAVGAASSKAADERFDAGFIQLRSFKFRLGHPPPELAHDLQGVPHGARGIAQLQQPSPEPIDVWPHPARLSSRSRHGVTSCWSTALRRSGDCGPLRNYAELTARHPGRGPPPSGLLGLSGTPYRHSSALGIGRSMRMSG
jgi:hypothetical protein